MKSRKPMVAGNWKMNKTLAESRDLIRAIQPEVAGIDGVDIVVCPPFVSLGVSRRETDETNIKVGAQNIHWEASGAYTGEVAAGMLVDLCEYVIIGHSERRAMFGETDATVNKKVHAALKAGLKPIMCVGETLSENQAGQTAAVVEGMVRGGLVGVTPEQAGNIIIAYEPVWAIGTGLAATPEGANGVHKDVIRPVLRELFGAEVGDAMRILYGGSVTAANAAELFSQSDIDGGLVGGASLKPDSFAAIVKAAL
ncbi:MAG TPA: triose-phosphate isomerase [Anaerolineaceae bacterium]|jgi:triosephosphate isomerase|nr:triose-phosphate isomerase [Anaerolineales bacterium]HOR84098.1 triose-phosphate isomerase [Anaerolineaceae bacterium]HOT52394.1 triose-phosphate isomerase [Anaerolineaceae bacterium]HPL43764.1 triose-phosphate isomerase [Anaerolineaceae bacterium]